MTILRPLLSLLPPSKTKTVDDYRQEAADEFWSWAEERIVYHTDKLCEKAIRDIVKRIENPADNRMRLILTQSAVTLDSQSPLDKLLSSVKARSDSLIGVKIVGSSSLTIESFQQTVIAAALGVTSSVVYSDKSSTGIPLKGLDLSILEEIEVDRDLVIVIDDGDAIDRELLFKIFRLIYFLQKSQSFRISVVLNTDLGEPLMEDIICDEVIFSDIDMVRVPILNIRDLTLMIRSIFFGNSSELRLKGYLATLPAKDFDFISKELPITSMSPLELCSHLLLSVKNWFKNSELSFIKGTDDVLDIEKEIKKSGWAPPRSKKFHRIGDQICNIAQVRKSLGILGRVIGNIETALRQTSEIVINPVEELTSTMLPPDKQKPLLKKCLTELESKQRRNDVLFKNVGLQLVASNSVLITELVNVFGFDESDQLIERLMVFNKSVSTLSNRNYGASTQYDELYDCVCSHIELELETARNIEISEEILNLITVPSTKRLDEQMNTVGYFDQVVEFIRSPTIINSNDVDQGLKDVHTIANCIYGKAPKKQGGRATKGKENSNAKNEKKITATYCDLDVVTKSFKIEEMAESLATLEYWGLIKPPAGLVDLKSNFRIRKIYRDTWLVPPEDNAVSDDDYGDD
jgi:hypothetical protein